MKCSVCGGEIDNGINVCPYCGSSVGSFNDVINNRVESFKSRADFINLQFDKAMNPKNIDMEKLEENFADISNRLDEQSKNTREISRKVDQSIDKISQLENAINYHNIDTKKLEEMYNNLSLEITKLSKNSQTNSKKLDDYYDKISQLEEEIQRRYPINPIILEKEKELLGIETSTVVNVLLHSFKEPDCASAAYKVRASIEKNLRDRYGFPFGKNNPDDPTETEHFLLSYFEMFNRITSDRNTAMILKDSRSKLNWFVHVSNENDNKIAEEFGNSSNVKIMFIENTLKAFKDARIILD